MVEPDPRTDRDILSEMRLLVARLGADGDALLAGQYAHLRARIEALLEITEVSDGD